MIRVVNIRKNELNKRGYKDFEDWSQQKDTVYIGRNMSFYVKGAEKSKWSNPFSVKKYDRDKCLELYEEYIKNNKDLMKSLEELKEKELGCWCHPEPCHGDILVKLLEENK